jgi:predicted nucleic acid-binding protein
MISVLLDTNVVLDVLLDRQPHAKHSLAVWAHIESGRMRGFLLAHAIITIHYLVRRELGESRATRVVASLLAVFSVAPVNDKVLAEALTSTSPDFEDAVMAAAARHVHCTFIVTRDPRGFKGSIVRAIPPEAANALITTSRLSSRSADTT